MQFVSTRNSQNITSFKEAIFHGLAPDGGLYCPLSYPDLRDFFLSLPEDIPFNELAARLTYRLMQPEINETLALDIVESAFNFEPKLQYFGHGKTLLELFHGPSCAFKDFGASFLASAMNLMLSKKDQKAIIITATSGDTGSAVAQAFHGKDCIDVVILYPSGRVSPLQEKQLTTLGGNVHALEVDGSFDDCQRMAKSALTNPKTASLPLSSANSINLGRLIPQSFYYVWAWTRLRNDAVFIVPSGNFGNITAGLYAASWGLPIKHFVAATNANDVVPKYLETGYYRPKPSLATISNAMDVGAPSNFERLDNLYKGNVDIFRKHVEAFSINDETTKNVIFRVYADHRYLCCPHTAVGWRVAEIYLEKNKQAETLILSTAHPGKFSEVIEDVTGNKPLLPPHLAALSQKRKMSIRIGNSNNEFAEYLMQKHR